MKFIYKIVWIIFITTFSYSKNLNEDSIFNEIPTFHIDENISNIEREGIANDLHMQGVSAYYAKNYKYAMVMYLGALEIRKELFGENHSDTATSYSNIGEIYREIGVYDKALEYALKALRIRIKISDKSNLDNIANSYNNLGLIHQAKDGNHLLALEYYFKALEINKKIYGEDDSSTLTNYANIAMAYKDLSNYEKALKYHKKSVDIAKKIFGKKHPTTLIYSTNLGDLYRVIGDYKKALNIHLKTLSLKKEVLGLKNLNTAISYNNIGMVYHRLGNFNQALKYYTEDLNINKSIFGEEHPFVANGYSNLASIYIELVGDYTKSLEYSKKALKIRKNIFGDFHPSVGTSYFYMGQAYFRMGKLKEALDVYKKDLKINETILGKNHIATADSYASIAMVYHLISDYDNAIKFYNKDLEIAKKVLGNTHYRVGHSYNGLAGVYDSKKEYEKAIFFYKKSLTIIENIFGTKHSMFATTCNNLAYSYYAKKDYKQAYDYAKLSFDIFIENKEAVLNGVEINSKEKYFNLNANKINILLDSLFKLNKNQKLISETVNLLLNYKGSVFDSQNSLSLVYNKTDDKELKKNINKFSKLNRELAILYQNKSTDKGKKEQRIGKVKRDIENTLNQIAIKTTKFGEEYNLMLLTYKDISDNLKENELYIDYIKAKDNYYFFTIDKKEKILFFKISKKDTQNINLLIQKFRKNMTDRDFKLSKIQLSKLYKLLITKPLKNNFQTKKKLIISPDGALRLLPFETLYDKKIKKYLVESIDIQYISSGKELIRLYKYSKNNTQNNGKTIIFANPNFDKKIDSSKSEVSKPLSPSFTKYLISMRGNNLDSLYDYYLPILQTKVEGKVISSIMKNTKLYEGEDATEENLFNIKQPKILHIATHGFFINDLDIPNSMLKSGIVLSGANESAKYGKDRGIVTALKLYGLNLKGTDLVVLSACDTGMVDINNTDSISGLGKAFIQAGAKDVVMSLWSVDDNATKELMVSFYKQIKLKAKPNYAKALKEAKLKMIDKGMPPFYWGGFVLLGL